jgi:mxaL protein
MTSLLGGAVGWRFCFQALAALLLAICLLRPVLPLPQKVYRYVMVIDITQSMNARDYPWEGYPADRLGFVKAALTEALQDLPCGSEVSLSLFTTQHAQMLFEPLEICEHRALLEDSLARIDWRMAWAADSHIARGLFDAIRDIAESGRESRLVFFTDGQQFPPDPAPAFHDKAGQVRGLIVGVGSGQAVPIPRLDRDNRPLGYWEYTDLKKLLPAAQSPDLERGGSNQFLSRVDEAHLRELSAVTGLAYHRLESPQWLRRALLAPELAERRQVAVDIRGGLAGLALLLFLMPFFRAAPGSLRRR